MAPSNFFKPSLSLVILFCIVGCQHQWLKQNTIEFCNIKYNSTIPPIFQSKAKKYFIQTVGACDSSLHISRLQFKKKNLYGGSSVRSRQIEILAELSYEIKYKEYKKVSFISLTSQFPSNELNPQGEISAQKELTSELESLLLESLMREILLIES